MSPIAASAWRRWRALRKSAGTQHETALPAWRQALPLSVCGATALVLLVLCLAFGFASNEAGREGVRATADRTAFALSGEIQEMGADLRLLADLLMEEADRQTRALDFADFRDVYDDFLAASPDPAPYRGLLLTDARGGVRFRSGDGFPSAPALAGTSIFLHHQINRSGRLLVTAAPVDETSDVRLMLSTRLRDRAGAFAGIAILSLDPSALASLAGRFHGETGYSVSVSDGNGLALFTIGPWTKAPAPAAARWIGDTPLIVTVQNAVAGEAGQWARLGASAAAISLLVVLMLFMRDIIAGGSAKITGRQKTGSSSVPGTDAAAQPAAFEDTETLRTLRQRLGDERLRAEAALRTKSEFLAHMSHELRTPLNAIIGFSEMIEQQVFGPVGHEKYTEYIGDIKASGHRLLSMVNQILDLARLETGAAPLRHDWIDPRAVIEEFVLLAKGRIEAAGLELKTSLAPLPRVRADRRALKQVLLHLVSNAIKYTDRGGRITLSARAEFDHVTLEIRDTGIGIRKDDLKRLLDPFERAGPQHEIGRSGAGLGLTLSRLLVELHGGRLDIASRYGAGTRVTIRLPRRRSQDEETRAEAA